MSFQSMEGGSGTPSTGPRSDVTPFTSPGGEAFRGLQQSLSLQLFKINSNVQGISKLVDQLGTAQDTASLRKTLHDLTDSTRDMVKRATQDLRKLSGLQSTSPQAKTYYAKTSHDLQLSLIAFQQAQRASAEKQRMVVLNTKQVLLDNDTNLSISGLPIQQQRQQQTMQLHLSPADLEFQESLVRQQEMEIRQIETGIHDVNGLFQALVPFVEEQGETLDNIEGHLRSVADNTDRASSELQTASNRQRNAPRRVICRTLILVIVICVVLLAVRIALIVVRPFPW